MTRIIAFMGLSLMVACAAPSATAEPEFDNCLITNMAAVNMLDEDIDKTEAFLKRARLTQEAYETAQAGLAKQRELVAALLTMRRNLLRDDTLDESEQAARASLLMRSYSRGADAAVEKAKAQGFGADTLAARATSCAQTFTASRIVEIPRVENNNAPIGADTP